MNMTKSTSVYDGWKFERTLGSGGFGIVQLWVHTYSAEKLAIKKCKWLDGQLTETQKERWINEVKIMKHINHPNIVETISMPFKLPNEILPVLCMEYCRKGDFRKILNKVENCCGIEEKEALKLFADISAAVEYLHGFNITHRDLKPENIVLQDMNNMITYKLIDLGYAKEIGEASTRASIVGTLHYVAPELLYKKKYSCTVDYWSLGILFYEVITGIRPFLPRMQRTVTWMQHIEKKDYNHICAYERNGSVIFGTDIEGPTQLSSCIKERLVEWFRVVLQWDPKKRGRMSMEGTSRIVVFSMLRTILSKKVLYVFCTPSYELHSYEIDDNTSVGNFQMMIEEKTGISVKHQILTNYYGKVITQCSSTILSEIEDLILYVFQNRNIITKEVPMVNVPPLIYEMIEQAGCQLDSNTIRDYYRVALFFMKKEIQMFQLYFFALTIKIDLIKGKMNVFDENMEHALSDISKLTEEVDSVYTKYSKKERNDETGSIMKSIVGKVNKLSVATDQMRIKFQTLMKNYDTLRNAAIQNDYMTDFSKPYNESLNIFESLKEEKFHEKQKPNKMIKEIFNFLNIREKLFREGNTARIAKEIVLIDSELETLEKSFSSVTAMIVEYRKELSNSTVIYDCNLDRVLELSDSEPPRVTPIDDQIDNDTSTSDNIIIENLVIRHTLDNLMTQVREKCMEILNLEQQ